MTETEVTVCFSTSDGESDLLLSFFKYILFSQSGPEREPSIFSEKTGDNNASLDKGKLLLK